MNSVNGGLNADDSGDYNSNNEFLDYVNGDLDS